MKLKRIVATLALLALTSVASFPQNLRYTYIAGYQVAASTSAKVTLQLPTSATYRARLMWVSVHCPDAVCSITPITGGTAATATLGTAGVRTHTDVPATAQAIWYVASNSTGGTSMPVQPLGQGLFTLGYPDVEIRAGERVSFVVTGSSQTVTINAMWEEYPR
jgi:hypothetical protein